MRKDRHRGVGCPWGQEGRGSVAVLQDRAEREAGCPSSLLHSEVKCVPGPGAPWEAGEEATPLRGCRAPSAGSVLSLRVCMGGFTPSAAD